MALAVQQLWHDAPWYIWFIVLCFGLLVIILGLAIVLHVHLNPLWNRIFLVTGVIFMCMGAFWYYETLPDHQPLSLVEVYITDFPQYFGQRGSYAGRSEIFQMGTSSMRSNHDVKTYHGYDRNDDGTLKQILLLHETLFVMLLLFFRIDSCDG